MASPLGGRIATRRQGGAGVRVRVLLFDIPAGRHMDRISATDSFCVDRLLAPFETASDALARLDERLRTSPVAEAFILRAHFRDVIAALWRQGEFVQLEDLVLHDANMDVRSPTHELVRAHEVLRARRGIAERAPNWALTSSGLSELRGERNFGAAAFQPRGTGGADREEADVDLGFDNDPENGDHFGDIDTLIARTSHLSAPHVVTRDDSGLVYDQDWDEASRLAEWRAWIDETLTLPPLIAAGLALDAWEEIEPLQHRAWLGPLLAGAYLRARGKTRHYLIALHAGMRAAKYRRARHQDQTTWLAVFARAIERMVDVDWKELDRLTLARELLMRKCNGRRANSKLPQLVELALHSPILSVPLVAKELAISQQAATVMLGELSSNLRELTGRGRYRAWGLV